MNRSLNQINRMQLVENHLPLIGKFYIIFSFDKKNLLKFYLLDVLDCRNVETRPQ